MARKYTPDIVLTDLRMPGLDGISAIRLIAGLEQPIGQIVISTYDDAQLIGEAFEAGALGYIVKNADTSEIMNAIKTVLGSLINVVAAAYFVFAGLVIWPQAIAMTLGATAGYYLGSRMAQKISQQQVRNLVGIIGVSLSLVFFWREFLAR